MKLHEVVDVKVHKVYVSFHFTLHYMESTHLQRKFILSQ